MVLGVFVHRRVRAKSNKAKTLGLLGVAIAMFLGVMATNTPTTDEEYLKRDWITNSYSLLEFKSPYELELATSSLPAGSDAVYKRLDVYMRDDRGRIMYCYDAELTAPIPLRNAFEGALNGLLMRVEHSDLELAWIDDHFDRVSAYIRFTNGAGEVVEGYGLLYSDGTYLQALWLVPIKRGFTQKFVEKFERNIERR